jgi:L-amino acid N-acyltransferase YncA
LILSAFAESNIFSENVKPETAHLKSDKSRLNARATIETAARKGIADAIVEKNFWVCWMLQQRHGARAFFLELVVRSAQVSHQHQT